MSFSAYASASDSITGQPLYLEVRSKPEGFLNQDDPTVLVVVRSESYEFMAGMDLSPEQANVLGEYLRRSAEKATRPAS